jgi:hypothetical protein
MDAASQLRERGFVIIPGPELFGRPELLVDAYTAAMASATGEDVKTGSTSTRVSDFVNLGAEFDGLYVFPPLLEACCRVIGRPFKLSSLLGRTLRPRSPAQELHVDVRCDSTDWPLLGFILMIDEFRPDNGATRFVPGSHRWPGTPEETISDPRAQYDGQVLACGHRAHCSCSTGPHGMVTPQTLLAGRADRSRARSFRGRGVPGPTSRPVCTPRRARDLGSSRGMCSRFDGSSWRDRGTATVSVYPRG